MIVSMFLKQLPVMLAGIADTISVWVFCCLVYWKYLLVGILNVTC